MWKAYSFDYIRKNRSSGIQVTAAAFISALFLSLLCSLSFNFWVYEIEKIILEEGDWHGRIVAEVDERELSVIENFANVENVTVNRELSEGKLTAVDIRFRNMRTVYRDMPRIAEKLGAGETGVSYHELLLSRYLIHDPKDETPPLLMTFFLVILCMVSLALILIIHNAFAVSMNARIHQFGIFASIGATPGQIQTCLLQEAAALCCLPILLGSLFGIVLSFGTIMLTNVMAGEMAGRHEAAFCYHPSVFAVTVGAAALTVLISAWLPARKLSRLTPLEAIRGTGESGIRRKKQSRVLALLFGTEGELAGNALAAQRRALRTSDISLTLSFLGFTVMLCFFTLSEISTNYTYFERYQDAWDVMVTLKDTPLVDWERGEALRGLPEVSDCIAYQKASVVCVISKTAISDELNGLGGLEAVAGDAVTAGEGVYFVSAPIVIMDDESFEEYCRQIGVAPEAGGCVVRNRIWDSINSTFRYRQYIPYVKENQSAVILRSLSREENTVEVPLLAYTQEAPVLREEYEDYALVQFVPLSLWRQIAGQLENAGADTYIRVLGKDGMTLAELNELEEELLWLIGREDVAESENRLQEKADDDSARKGMMLILGAFCALLALIGIANVFSNTLGFLRQRKREFARYMSVGLTPESMRKIFAVEALVIAGRPLLITLPLTAAAVWFMITASCLNPMDFWEKAPAFPILVFAAAIFAFVGLAYYIGGKKLLACSLADALRNDTMI